MRELPPLEGGKQAGAVELNESGQVVGWSGSGKCRTPSAGTMGKSWTSARSQDYRRAMRLRSTSADRCLGKATPRGGPRRAFL
jgi:hypothetical protein